MFEACFDTVLILFWCVPCVAFHAKFCAAFCDGKMRCVPHLICGLAYCVKALCVVCREINARRCMDSCMLRWMIMSRVALGVACCIAYHTLRCWLDLCCMPYGMWRCISCVALGVLCCVARRVLRCASHVHVDICRMLRVL